MDARNQICVLECNKAKTQWRLLQLNVLVVLLTKESENYEMFMSQWELRMEWSMTESVRSPCKYLLFHFVLISFRFWFRSCHFQRIQGSELYWACFHTSSWKFLLKQELHFHCSCNIKLLSQFIMHYETVLCSSFSSLYISPQYLFQFLAPNFQSLSAPFFRRLPTSTNLTKWHSTYWELSSGYQWYFLSLKCPSNAGFIVEGNRTNIWQIIL